MVKVGYQGREAEAGLDRLGNKVTSVAGVLTKAGTLGATAFAALGGGSPRASAEPYGPLRVAGRQHHPVRGAAG